MINFGAPLCPRLSSGTWGKRSGAASSTAQPLSRSIPGSAEASPCPAEPSRAEQEHAGIAEQLPGAAQNQLLLVHAVLCEPATHGTPRKPLRGAGTEGTGGEAGGEAGLRARPGRDPGSAPHGPRGPGPHGPPRPPTYLRSSGSRRSAAWRTARPPPARTASGRAGTARTLRGAAPGERLSPVSPARCPRVPGPVSPARPGPTLQHLPLAHGGGPAAAQGRAVYPSPWQPGGSRAAEGEGAWPRRRP